MDSLVSNYASSDEDDNAPPKQLNNESHLSSMPPPKKSSIFSYLPPPPPKSQSNPKHRQTQEESDEQFLQNSNPKSMFSFIPAPKSAPKKVVQFKPPVMLNSNPRSFIDGDDDDDEDDEGEKERLKKKLKDSVSTSSPESFLSTIPAPRYSGALGGSGMGRKSMLETATPASTQPIDTGDNVDSNAGLTGDQSSHANSGGESNAYYGGYTAGVVDATGGNGGALNSQGSSEVWSAEHNYDHSGTYSVGDTYAVDYSYGGDVEDVQYTNPGVSYVGYGDNVQYEEKWANAATLPTGSDMIPEMQVSGRRRRKDAPPQIIEVKQDELMKNRPREDQVKSTGIAFGPAYQPTSSKGKPTKLHKRKHQIGSLYFDMRQKETELAERRSQGFQTKAQTQAKYGW